MSYSHRLDLWAEGQMPVAEPPLLEGAVVFRAQPRPLYQGVKGLRCVQSFYPTYAALQGIGVPVSDFYAPDSASPHVVPRMIIVELVRARAENLAMIADGFDALDAGGLLVVDGQKNDGIESVLRQIRAEHPIEGVFSKSHGKTFWLYKGDAPLHSEARDWQAAAEPKCDADGWWSRAGVFSANRIDAGSAFLAEHLPDSLGKRVADFGGGTGWLCAQVLARCEAKLQELHLFEAEARAIALAQKNITDGRLQTHWCDITTLPAPKQGSGAGFDGTGFDGIVMNPPFHASAKSEPALGQRFIEQARVHLATKGQLWLVANRHLPYEASLSRCFKDWRLVAENGQFKVICARGVPKTPFGNSGKTRYKGR